MACERPSLQGSEAFEYFGNFIVGDEVEELLLFKELACSHKSYQGYVHKL